MKHIAAAVVGMLALLQAGCSDDETSDPPVLTVPRDYFATYYSDAYFSEIHLVDVNTFTSNIVIPGTMHLWQYAGRVEDGVIRERRPYALYYFHNSHWYRRSLRTDGPAASVQLTAAPQPPFAIFPFSRGSSKLTSPILNRPCWSIRPGARTGIVRARITTSG